MSVNIQWFPGHMAKARREVQEKLKFVDIVYEMLDARLPISSRNPMLNKILQQKPRLILINKGDSGDREQLKKWRAYFKAQGYHSLIINALQNTSVGKIISESKVILKKKLERDKTRGLKSRAIRVMIIGIPNVGKSTLINRIIGQKKAQVENRPGVTKAQQWIRLNSDLELLDTPGILWPKFEDEEIGKKLALTGAIKDQLLHANDIALFGLAFFVNHFPKRLIKRYSLTEADLSLPTVDLLLLISRKRGFKDDYERASQMIVQEIRTGKMGPYTLDLFY
ncbi:MAG: ribosome biogenesis GTPase YlqF [Streptococcaceae bacterium]|jgi:ribosome biogenesis GTPase A|nr:ribosome biogenesis GTPase YlqF [Streptococcaceae bacterium]